MRSIAVILLASSVAACAPEPASEATPSLDPELQRASAGLCDALRAASEGDVERAAALFEDEAHGYLHELADRVGARDRSAAAELLEAKQRAEAALARPWGPEEVVQALEDVGEELADAAAAIGMPRPTCEAAA